MKKLLAAVSLAFLLLICLTVSAGARSATPDRDTGSRPDQVGQYNLTGFYPWVGKTGPDSESEPVLPSGASRRSVGSALSPEAGIGVGESIDVTFNDMQYGFPSGRYISHYYNGDILDPKAGVHFVYESCTDTVPGDPLASITLSGYNFWEATEGGDWPRGQDIGCDLEVLDPDGTGQWVNLDVTSNGTAVMASTSRFFAPLVPDNRIYYQEGWSNCYYNATLGTRYIDSTIYRPAWHNNAPGNYSVQPQVQTQFVGGNTIVHVLLGEEEAFLPPAGDNYVDNANSRIFAYYRKVGDLASEGAWSAGQIIDTIVQVYSTNGVTLMPSSVSSKVCVSYSNPTVAARILDKTASDIDIYYRESLDAGLTWPAKVNVTNFDNATEGSAAHFKGWVESPCLYDSDDDLHIIWTGTPTSANPYYDGYNWDDFDTDIYHWARSTNEIAKVANGSYLNDDWLTGSMNQLHCGFADEKTGYISFIWLSECDGKLYCIWNQIHERANRFDWRNSTIIPAPGILDDCAFFTGDRRGKANSEIMMSVAYLESSSCWDYARNITNTYKPNCGLPWYEDADGICGNEWKPAIEKFALDETGLDLTWPDGAKVDMTPEGDPAYTGDWYLNMEYIDDQYPGGFIPNSRAHTDNGSLNSEKWVRLACVEPVEAPIISAAPRSIAWPRWVKTGHTSNIPVVVKNEGNVVLKVTKIGTYDNAGGWLSVSENPTSGTPFEVSACIDNTNTFDIIITPPVSEDPTWLDGYVWLKSDAVNNDSLVISIHMLAADTVEPVVWDTVMTHPNMYHPFLSPTGACVGLAVGNMGELGWGAGSDGRVGLDYQDAARNMSAERRECDTTVGKNRIYLVSATPFVLLANGSDGSGAELTQSFNDLNQVDETSFDPTADKGSLRGGVNAVKGYDSAYTGKFVNRDTTIAMERIVYGPRSATPATDIINFMIVYTKVYSADGLPHNHVTIGNASDYDVPSDNYNHNLGGIVADNFVYVQGTDTTGHNACASNVGRYATEAFGGGYTSAEFDANPCVNNTAYKGMSAIEQIILTDTSKWGGVPVTPAQPNPLVWWNTASVGGLSVVEPMPDTGRDLATFLTYKHDYNLGATETLHYWTVMTTTPIGGSVAELTAQVAYAKTWYMQTVRGCEDNPSCCVGRVGDANMSLEPTDEITLGDIMLMVDVKFISGDCTKLTCLLEADVTQDGGASPSCDDNVTLGDIMTLVDFLFITGPEVAVLKTCL